MKKILFVAIVACFSLVIVSCGDDDKKCLVCDGSSENEVCEGDKDPDTGQEITIELLEISRDLANALGADCELK